MRTLERDLVGAHLDRWLRDEGFRRLHTAVSGGKLHSAILLLRVYNIFYLRHGELCLGFLWLLFEVNIGLEALREALIVIGSSH